jgi:hypothetical protein
MDVCVGPCVRFCFLFLGKIILSSSEAPAPLSTVSIIYNTYTYVYYVILEREYYQMGMLSLR